MKATFLLILMAVASVCAAQKTAAKPAAKPAEKKAKAPLPAGLLSAQTMCIKVLSATDADVAEAKTELAAWGHFQVKEDCAQADVALWLNARVRPEINMCRTLIQVIANSDRSVLWNKSVMCKVSTKGTVGRLVRSLRKEMTPPAPAKSKT